VERYHEVETALAAYNAGLRYADEWAEQGGDIREAIAFRRPATSLYGSCAQRSGTNRLYPDAFSGRVQAVRSVSDNA
jgi:hypothetical protein